MREWQNLDFLGKPLDMVSEKWWDQKLGFTYVSMKSHWNLPGHIKYCTRDFRNSLAMLTLGGAGYGYSTLNQDIHVNVSTYIECQTVLQRSYDCTHQCWACAHDHVTIYYKYSSNQNFSQ